MSHPASRWISFFALGLLAACTAPTTPPPAPGTAAPGSAPNIDALLARMTLEQKVAQIMIIGFDGPTYDLEANPDHLQMVVPENYTRWGSTDYAPQLRREDMGDGDWSIEPGTAYISRYRIVVMDGKPDAAQLERLWQDYAEPVSVEVK